MVAVKDRMDESLIDWPAILGLELRQLLAPLLKGRRTLAGPHHRVQREPRNHVRMALGEYRRAQRARGYPVDQEWPLATQFLDIKRCGVAIVRALRDRSVVVAVFGGTAIAFHIDAPAVISTAREMIHRRAFGPSRHLQTACRLRRHCPAVHEEDGADRLGRITGVFFKQEQLHIAVLCRPVILALDRGGRFAHFVHHVSIRQLMGGMWLALMTFAHLATWP